MGFANVPSGVPVTALVSRFFLSWYIVHNDAELLIFIS